MNIFSKFVWQVYFHCPWILSRRSREMHDMACMIYVDVLREAFKSLSYNNPESNNNLGEIWASVGLDTKALASGVATARHMIRREFRSELGSEN